MVGTSDKLRIKKALKVLDYVESQFLTREENLIIDAAKKKLMELI